MFFCMNDGNMLYIKIDESSDQFKFYRQMAKNITFGILYGLGNKRLAQQLSTTTEQAKAYKQQYFNMKNNRDSQGPDK